MYHINGLNPRKPNDIEIHIHPAFKMRVEQYGRERLRQTIQNINKTNLQTQITGWSDFGATHIMSKGDGGLINQPMSSETCLFENGLVLRSYRVSSITVLLELIEMFTRVAEIILTETKVVKKEREVPIQFISRFFDPLSGIKPPTGQDITTTGKEHPHHRAECGCEECLKIKHNYARQS